MQRIHPNPKPARSGNSAEEWRLPIAILLAGALIGLAVYAIHRRDTILENGNPAAVRPISAGDHLVGSPNAPVVIIEYADIDSEYAKDFEQTMEQVMQNYGAGGNVAWVFRHFPLIGQNSYSEEHAEAAECVAAQGGTTAFFKFIDDLQAAAPSDMEFNPSGYPAIISALGLSQSQFNSCLQAHTYRKVVEQDYDNAIQVGATGSPYSILLVRGQKPAIISGSLPYDAMKQVIDASISKALVQ